MSGPESAAALFARGGVTAGAWLVSWAYCLVAALVPTVTCEPPSSDPYLATALFALPTALLVSVTGVGLRFRAALRWLTLPLALLIPLAAAGVVPALGAAGARAAQACHVAAGLSESSEPTSWHSLWAPLNLALLLVIGIQAMRYWQRPARD